MSMMAFHFSPRNLLEVFFICTLLCSSAGAAGKGWVNDGPEGTFIRSLAIDPQNPKILYAGGGGKIYKSTDGGSVLATMNGFPANESLVYVVVINPQTPTTLYASTNPRGTYKSTDGGNNWVAKNSGMETSIYGHYAMAVNPQNPEILYVGAQDWGGNPQGSGVFESTNGGDSWHLKNGPGVFGGVMGDQAYFCAGNQFAKP
jgi:hypothetical protein